MSLAIDVITLGVPDVPAARTFYAAALSPEVTDQGGSVDLDLHGRGHVGLLDALPLAAETGATPATSGFRGFVLSCVVDQPGEVRAIEQAATAAGATVRKPAKKGFFGGFTGVLQAPDGAVWKLAAPHRKDKAQPRLPPRPTETGVILGVADPVASRDFYSALGLTVDRDYGAKFIDFAVEPDTSRLGLMTRAALAEDAGVDDDGGSSDLVLHRRAESREEVETLLEAATAAGGRIVAPAAEQSGGGYGGHFADLDGFLWKVGTAA
ncbi:VOC family protein [Aeromicrobium sp. CF4.19]|uniref:VOC family protein n=1 Tax=Aeromicrobium sp. CF4.19 TaxID=3373082 RepID=UPI003EE426A7